MLALPLLAQLLPIKFAVPMMLLLDLSATVLFGLRVRSRIRLDEFGPLVPFMLAGMLLGVTLLIRVPQRVLLAALGVFVLGYAVFGLVRRGVALRFARPWCVPIGLIGGALAALFPWNLGVKANPFASAPAGIKPEWYFLFMFQSLKYIPAKIFGMDGEVLGILTFGVGGLIWALVPFIDRGPATGKWSRKVTRAGIILVIYILIMTAVAYVTKGSH